MATWTLGDIERAVQDSWSAQTAFMADDVAPWSEQNRPRGQCGPTALVVQDLLGGDLLLADVTEDGDRCGVHYWNRFGAVEVDLTREQFGPGHEIGPARVVVRPAGGPRAGTIQYRLLRERVFAILGLRPDCQFAGPRCEDGRMTPVPLTNATLADLPADIPRPTYDRDAISIGIVHIGVGGFHRAHQAMFLDRLQRDGLAREWGICGVGVLPGDARMAEVLHRQNGLYTLVEKAGDGSRAPRVIGSIVDYLHAPADPNAAIERMAHPDTKIVSLTVTEGGYNIDAVTGEFNADEPGVRADLAGSDSPRTTFGLLTEALRRRRDRDIPAFSVMSCDNIEGNGHIAARVFTAFARLADPQLAAWIEANVRFPNSMVDRITPVTTAEDVAMVRDELGIDDGWPVVCEPFVQWVLEDSFGMGRPPYERAGVQVVDDVRPYELMKLRLLNASHQALCYFGYLAGYRYAHDVAQDPTFARFLLQYMDLEGAPTLDPVPGIDVSAYQRELIERFSNANVRDTVARLCTDSSDRIPKFLLPVIRAQLAIGGPIERAAGVVASWARYAEGRDENGDPIEIVDPLADQLRELAGRGGTAFIDNQRLFGDLGGNPRFVAAYRAALDSLHSVGARETVARLAESAG